MATVSTYLNFTDQTEAAFNFYKSVFGGEFESFSRFGEMPSDENMPPLPEKDKQLIMHVSLKILGGHALMGSDLPPGMGMTLTKGNNVQITLNPDSREETDRLFRALSAGGKVNMELQDTFWDAYFGSCTDKFGMEWMFNFTTEE